MADANRLSLHIGETTLTLPFTPQQGAPHRQCLHLLTRHDAGANAARIAHGTGAIERDAGIEHLPAFIFITGRHDHHIGDAAQEAQRHA
jgi:hypothetical protein